MHACWIGIKSFEPKVIINQCPIERKDKVLEEISRPVFTYLEKGPLFESCTFISYDSLLELSKEKYIEHMTDSVVDEYVDEEDT